MLSDPYTATAGRMKTDTFHPLQPAPHVIYNFMDSDIADFVDRKSFFLPLEQGLRLSRWLNGLNYWPHCLLT